MQTVRATRHTSVITSVDERLVGEQINENPVFGFRAIRKLHLYVPFFAVVSHLVPPVPAGEPGWRMLDDIAAFAIERYVQRHIRSYANIRSFRRVKETQSDPGRPAAWSYGCVWICLRLESRHYKSARAVRVQQFERTHLMFSHQIGKPCRQQLQFAGVRGLRSKQSLLYIAWPHCMTTEGNLQDGGTKRVRLQIELQKTQQESAIGGWVGQLNCPAIKELIVGQGFSCDPRRIKCQFIVDFIGCQGMFFEF